MAREIVWNKKASHFLSQVLKRISVDSMLQAERVEEIILISIHKLNSNPETHPPDKFKKRIMLLNFGLLRKCHCESLIKLQAVKYEFLESGM